MTDRPRVLVVGSKALGFRVLGEVANMPGVECAGMVTCDDRGDARSRLDTLQWWCVNSHVPLTVVADAEDAEGEIRRVAPDCVVVACWYWRLGAPLLASVPMGGLGLHNSLLPRDRGGAPLVWAMIRGDREVGVTLWRMTDRMDAGPVLGQTRTTVGPDELVGPVLDRLTGLGVGLVREWLPVYLHGLVPLTEQDEAQATYNPQRRPEDGLIDFTWPAKRVGDWIRAQSYPYPGAWTWWQGERLTVWEARTSTGYYPDAEPGTVCGTAPWWGMDVACAGGQVVTLGTVQRQWGSDREGARRVLTLGERLGVGDATAVR